MPSPSDIIKVLVISGSPRKGNTEWMLHKIGEYLSQSGAELETLLLRKLDVKRCVGCLTCEDRQGQCQLKDDMNDVYPKILEADVIILGTPVYFELVSGLLKNFMDRTCPIWTKMAGKSVAGLAVAEEGIGQAVRNLQTYAAVCNMHWVGSVTALAKRPGEVAQVPGLELKLKRLSQKIIKQCHSSTGSI